MVAWCTTALAYNATDTAKTIATDGSQADTASALAYVKGKAQDGWVMTVGTAGSTYVWTSGLAVDVPYNFTMQGTSASNRPSVTTNGAISIAYALGKVITIKDFIFPETTQTNATWYIKGSGPTAGFRFTNCKWIHPASSGSFIAYIGAQNGYAGTSVEGPYGLIDHCEVDGGGAGFGVWENNNDGTGLAAWRRPMTWGTQKAVYFEDCYFHSPTYTAGRAIVDSYFGGRVVFRRNTVDNIWIGDHGADHAFTKLASALQHEVMHNKFTLSADNVAAPWMVFFRGGTGVIFDNAFSVTGAGAGTGSELTRPVYWAYFRADPGAGPSNGLYDRWYSKTSVAGRLPLSGGLTDYLGTMQPGSGYVGTPGQDPNFPNEPWGSVPIFQWKNTRSGRIYFGNQVGQDGGFIVLNRDWFDYDAADKPSNTGKWVDSYTEYTYPHPLQARSSEQLAAPTNVRIQP